MSTIEAIEIDSSLKADMSQKASGSMADELGQGINYVALESPPG